MSRTNDVSTPRRFWETPLFWLVGLVGSALVATLLLTAGDDDTAATDVAQTAPVELSGPALASFSDPDQAIGATVPTFSAQTFDGGRATLAPNGTARLYGFFAHWCPHCQREVPRVADWLDTHDLPAGVEVIAISTGVDSSADNYPPSEWFSREVWPATVVMDDEVSSIASGFGLTSFPFWVTVDADGVVVDRIAGEISTADFESMIANINPAT